MYKKVKCIGTKYMKFCLIIASESGNFSEHRVTPLRNLSPVVSYKKMDNEIQQDIKPQITD